MNSKSELGQLGEDLACKYLVENGYKIIERNFWKPWGELDIVAKYKDGTLVFVEVKTMQGRNYNHDDDRDEIKPEDQLTKAKLRKLKRTASLYAGHRPELINDKKGWRIDLIAINVDSSRDLTDYKKDCDIRYYENI
ncbi:YraN family protein [Candidatus Wolfebacteria bacterium]|nr:YraN family protein [Candidatus Wolfebacteria bacterium]